MITLLNQKQAGQALNEGTSHHSATATGPHPTHLNQFTRAAQPAGFNIEAAASELHKSGPDFSKAPQ